MSRTLKCIIVEDELMARKSLSNLCNKCDSLELLGQFGSGVDASTFLEDEAIDLIFLDVEMPEMSGIEFMSELSVSPQIIITTSKKKYAFEAFEYDVTDFLVKPIVPHRFQYSVEKVLKRKQYLDSISTSSAQNEIFIKSDGKYVRLPFESILFFENVGDYISVVTLREKYLIHGSMKSMDAKLQYPRFLKVHRSYIVNLDKVINIEDNSLLIDSHVIPISRAHKSILMGAINLI